MDKHKISRCKAGHIFVKGFECPQCVQIAQGNMEGLDPTRTGNVGRLSHETKSRVAWAVSAARYPRPVSYMVDGAESGRIMGVLVGLSIFGMILALGLLGFMNS